jgi:hypothetical protein
MTFQIIGKADGDNWYRSEITEYARRVEVDDVILLDDIVHVVRGGYGYKPVSLWVMPDPAMNDPDPAMAEIADYDATMDTVSPRWQ